MYPPLPNQHYHFHHLQKLFGWRVYELKFQELILMLMVPCIADENMQNSVYATSWTLNCAIKIDKWFEKLKKITLKIK